MNRRLKTILLPLALAVAAAGCGTFSDAVARVGDDELSPDGLDELLSNAGVAEGDLVGTRQVITDWIIQTAPTGLAEAGPSGVSDAEAADLYDQGIEASGITCPALVEVADSDVADDVESRIRSGEPFDDVFAETNVAPDLATNGGFVGCFPLDAFPLEVIDQTDVAALFSVNAANPAEAFDLDGAALVVVFRGLGDIESATATEALGFVRERISSAAAFDDADVDVDSRYGYFDPLRRAVLPLG